jgi:hypothetical protein
MSDTSGRMSYAPFARWDRDSQCWKTSEATSLWALTLSSLTLPAWGGLHDGELCEHPTPERLTSALDYSSLPTPSANDTTGAEDQAQRQKRGAGGPMLRDLPTLLPTPAVNDMGRGKTPEDWDAWTAKMQAAHGNGNGHGKSLEIEAQRLLPTPAARDSKGPHMADRRGGLCLARTVGETTAPQLPDGNTSLDERPQHLLSQESLALPA